MRKTLMAVLGMAGVFGLVVSSELGAQPGGGGRPGAGGIFGGGGLINNKSVQEEIKLTEDQLKEMKAMDEKIREEMAEAQKKLAAEMNKKRETVLKPEQLKRFKQIELQQQYVAAFNSEDVQKELKVTDAQKEKLKKIVDEYNKEAKSLSGFGFGGGMGGMGGGKFDLEEMRKKMEDNRTKLTKLRKETLEDAVGVLDADQKTKWKTMIGEAFEVKQDRGGFGMGGMGGTGKGKNKDD